MLEAAATVDYCSEIPRLEPLFLEVWAEHYRRLGALAAPAAGFLEIGTGFGLLAVGAARLSGQGGVGIEHPSRAYFSSPSYRNFLRAAGIELLGADLRAGLPFRDGCFALIYLCDVIEHLFFMDVRLLLAEISRVLRPGGKLVLSTPNLNRLGNLCRILKGYSPNPPLYPESCGDTYGHIRELAPRELAALLARHGLCLEKEEFGLNPFFTAQSFGVENVFSPRGAAGINAVNRFLHRFIPRLGDEIYVVAVKRQ